MIHLHQDCLMFQVPGGETVPCSAEQITVELMGDSAELLDPEVVRNAARAVLHYFKVELGRTAVSVGEFSEALATVLRGFGLVVSEIPDPSPSASQAAKPGRRVGHSDLVALVSECGGGFELAFFARLRVEFRRLLTAAPEMLEFSGLRPCVKQLSGAKRWSGRCQQVEDGIVDYLRCCLQAEPSVAGCGLMVH